MIIESKKLIETSGNFEDEIEMQVNTNNTGKLFELLISSYKNARASMIRETVSNAYDAQIEGKNTQEPVVVNIDYDDSGWFIEIIDKGIGMTKEFVEKIYSSLLSSTKDKNNEQIGGFGIGSKSPLAYYPQFQLTTVKEGKLNSYLVYREGTGLPKITRMIIDEETNLHNGSTVRIPLTDDEHGSSWNKISEPEFILDIATKELSFFDNVIIKSKTRNSYQAGIYNDGKIIDGEDFLFRTSCQYSEQMHLVIGKVCYSIDWKQLGMTSIEIPIGVKFNIGDFQVNMTREDVVYDDEAKEKIKKAIENVKKKLELIYRNKNKDFTEIIPYLKARDKFKNNRRAKITFLEDLEESELDITPIFKNFDKNINYLPFKEANINVNLDIKNLFIFINIVNEYENGATKYRKEYPQINFQYDYSYANQPLVLIDNDKPNKIENKDFIKYHKNFTLFKIKSLKHCYKEILSIINYDNKKIKVFKKVDNWGDLEQVSEKDFKKSRPEDLENPLEIQGCTNLGWSIKAYNYYKIIKEQFYNICEEKKYSIIKYNTFIIPQEWYDEQKAIAKALRESYKSLSGQIKITDLSLENSIERTIHLQNLKFNTKLLFYGHIREKQSLFRIKAVMQCFNKHNDSFKDPTYRIWQILKIDEKTMENIPNAVHVDTFLKNPNRLILKFLAACDFQERYYKLTTTFYIDNLKKINFYYGTLLETLHNEIKNEFSLNKLNSFISDKLLYEELKKVHNYNEFLGSRGVYDKYTYRIKQLDEFFKDIELLKDDTIVKYSNIPYIVDYLKLKGKKVNIEHYNLSKNPATKFFGNIKHPENSFKGWGVETKLVEWNPEITRNDMLHIIYKNDDIINNLEQTTDEMVQKMA